MKRIFTLFTKLLLLIFFPGLLFAQGKNDYTINLQAGRFTPLENINAVDKNSPVFLQSFFGDKYYVTLQFNTIPDATVRTKLAAAGIDLIDYIPHFAYTAIVKGNFDLAALKGLPIRSILQFSTEQKMPASFFKGTIPAHAVKQSGYADVVITTYEKISADKIAASLNAIGASIVANNEVFKNYDIRVPIANVNALASLPFIQWAEPVDPPNTVENLPGRTLHRVNILNDGVRNLKGDGIVMGIWDGGQINTSHLDFSPAGRITTVRAGSTISTHATHVAGTMTGKGIGNPIARGMAPNSTLFSWDFNTNIQAEMATEIPNRGLIVSNHSYGSTGTPTCSLNDPLGTYNTTSRNTDINLNDNLSHLHVHSAGNSGGVCPGGFLTITGSGKSAKNNLVVSDITTLEAIAGTSSRGPVQDGRIKPEISAMGSNVFSTWSPGLTPYATISGTSMATPGVSGSAALLYQRYKQLNSNNLPPSSLIKNIICNAAADLGNAGPDYTFGFGRIDALSSVEILEQNRYSVNTIANGATNFIDVTVPAGTVLLKAMLTWNDPAGAMNANPALVNDLDLTVVNGATSTLPWILNKNSPAALATRGTDNYSNIEQVTITNPPVGTYRLNVAGTNITSGPNQVYALTWIIEQQHIEVLYPNGGENLAPGVNQTITWNNAGITSNQTVEYSLNNGGNWTTISSTVPPATTRLTWTVPSTSTSTALIRISSGAVTDVSDANFSIFGLPTLQVVTSSACSAGEISYTWPAVTDATHYDLYRLDLTTGNFVIMASNIVGTGHTVTSLIPGETIWAALVAKNNTTGAVSPRSNPVSGVISTGGGGLGTIGSVTGQNLICGTPTAVMYSIPAVTGATSYTWTIPSGAVIVSGQGTVSIIVSYPSGSVNGNVTVFATAGSCQTPTSAIAVTVAGAINPPTSGGDQTANVCPGDPVPTLTAIATAPAGHTVTWYTAASGGIIVASPILAAAGTITYYAASRNTTTTCESNTRIPVTLTITQVAAASIAAGSPTTFCQGGSVVLTATAGTSYLWSNGATTQAITVNGPLGTTSYTVAITQTGGCVSNSPAISVTVNAAPPASITAGGVTTFCQGGNVVLTASAGNSWLWSNGSTTQSITVTATGNHSVTVTSAGNCSATSAPMAVAVSPNPVVNISASPYTSLFPGLSTTLTANVTPPGTYNYAWFKNGILIPGAATSTLTGIDLDDLGSYTVTVTNTTGLPCSNTSPALAILDSATTKLFIYPSPNNGQFQVRYYATGTNPKHTVMIYDSKGSLVHSGTYNTGAGYQQMNVDMRQFGKGIYKVVLFDKSLKKLADGSVVIQ